MAISDPIDACRFWLHDTGGTTFTDAQIQEFLDLERYPDEDGYEPGDDDYTPTYDVLKAAGRGWLWLSGNPAAWPRSYRVGDVQISYTKDFCLSRARELLGSYVGIATRSDEQKTADTSFRFRTS